MIKTSCVPSTWLKAMERPSGDQTGAVMKLAPGASGFTFTTSVPSALICATPQ